MVGELGQAGDLALALEPGSMVCRQAHDQALDAISNL